MSGKIDYIVPDLLRVMADNLVKEQIRAANGRDEERLQYIASWIYHTAVDIYRDILKRDGVNSDPFVIKLLCENAILRGLVKWHEIKDAPPSVPSLKHILD